MSKGLGKTQQNILEALRNLRQSGDWYEVNTLACYAYHKEKFEYEGKYHIDNAEFFRASYSEIMATHRAIKKLEKAGLVETKINRVKGPGDFGQAAYWKVVRVKDCPNLESVYL